MTQSAAQQNVTVVQKIYEAFGRGDLPGLLSFLSADIDWELIGPREVPYFNRFQGHEEVQRCFALMAENGEYEEFAVDEMISAERSVIVLGRERKKFAASGRSYTARWCHIFDFADGKVLKFREFIEPSPIVEALR
ncbi:MAG: nuclear transport factor 2 family protein [Bdellovibrionota bacterium]